MVMKQSIGWFLFSLTCTFQAASMALAQTTLEELERSFANPADRGALPDNPPAPPHPPKGPGYFGFVVENRSDGGSGVQVLEIVEEGPAARAKLQEGDIITSVGKRLIKSADDFAKEVESLQAGTQVPLIFVRDNRANQTTLVLAERPRSAKTPDRIPPKPNGPMRNQGGAEANPSELQMRVLELEGEVESLSERVARLERLLFRALKDKEKESTPDVPPQFPAD